MGHGKYRFEIRLDQDGKDILQTDKIVTVVKNDRLEAQEFTLKTAPGKNSQNKKGAF